MSRRQSVVRGLGLIAALVLVPPSPVHTQAGDLDLLNDATLQRDLEAELDDIYADFDPNNEFQLAELKAAMIEALGDEGDDGVEEEISFDELEAEMDEADTTLEDVLDEALEEADAIASSEGQTWSIVRVSARLGLPAQRRGNGRTTPRQATQQAVRSIIRASNVR